MSNLIRIPFHGTEILAADVKGKPQVVLKPAIESIGLDYKTQHRKLVGKSWATVGMVPTVGSDGKVRQMTTVDVRTFLMLLATIDENRVAEEARPLLVAYQAEVADAIEAYWTKGGVINPRATEVQLSELAQQAQAQMSVIQLAKGIIADDYLETKARLVLARSMGEEPEIDPADRPIDVSGFLADKGLSAKDIRKWGSAFGRRLKALYVAKHGTEPKSVDRFVNGTVKTVNGYFGRDLPLLEEVFELMHDKLTGAA